MSFVLDFDLIYCFFFLAFKQQTVSLKTITKY